MTDRLILAAAQIDPTVGDLAGNAAKILAARVEAAALGADLVIFSELCLVGYPPEDLVLKPQFQAACDAAITALAAATGDGGPALLIGAIRRAGPSLRNSAFLLAEGGVLAVRDKYDLPNYGVFDEKRVFTPGAMPGPMIFKGWRLGVMICEDMWAADVAETLAESGAELLVVMNGSPFEQAKIDERQALAAQRVNETGLALLYVNQLGGQDELVFDGASFALGRDATLCLQLPAFRPAVATLSWHRSDEREAIPEPGPIAPLPGALETIWEAMVLGLGDYVRKNRFPGVILGLSGGIDSAIAAAIAVDALGPEMVRAVMMPSPYTSAESLEDAAEVARLLHIRLDEIPISPAMAAFDQSLAPLFAGRAADLTEENIQSRCRGLLLMALSNKFGHMVLSTGNKSEMSAGYATLYGDMCGGFAVLKDVYKTTIFALADWRNRQRPAGLLGPDGPVMPQRVIDKPPSAELRPDQKDEDSLPPYPVLDAILQRLIEGEVPLDAIIAEGFESATVKRVWRMLDRAEYKRRQAPPGVKLTRRAFGRERRYPITNGFVDQATS